jgi:hypothetical protein
MTAAREQLGRHSDHPTDCRADGITLEFENISGTIELEHIRRGRMKFRIAMWASAGVLVAGCWAVYGLVAPPPAMTSADPVVPLVRLTCPIALLAVYPLRLYWVLFANAATYALLGLILETIRKKAPTSRIIQDGPLPEVRSA